MADDLPTGRWRRAAKVGRLAGGQTARGYATKAANLTRSEDGRRDAAARRQMEAAEQIFEVLGQMKGAAMKVGQVASFIDTGAFPPEFQERIQAKLAELRDAAPRVPFDKMRKLIENDLGESLADVFAEFDEDAVAAASIGQVYRARLHDGRAVAVKVQYPGVAQAVRADLQNLGLIMRVAKRMAPGMDAKAMTREIRERLTDELDYEHEAQQHRAFARSWRGHPFIYVPPVVTELSSEHVLVSEWVDGTGFEEIRAADRATRDRFGEIVFRFFFGSLYRNGHFSGDPHPGNYRLMDDGRVAFIDFGMTKRVTREDLDAEIAALRFLMDGDVAAVHRQLGSMGFFDPADEEVEAEAVYEHFHDVTRWYVEDRELTVDRALVSQVLIDFGDPRSRHWQLMRRETMPPQAMLARRMEALTLGVLGQLEATANWHRIAREWLFDDAPSTELGELEQPFHKAGGRMKATKKAVDALRAADPVMERLIDGHHEIVKADLKRERPGDAYGALLRSIVGQQLSTKAASTIYGRMLELFGGHAPTPKQLLKADPEKIRAAGLSRPKIAYLRDLAQHVEEGTLELERLPDLPDEEVAAQLTAIKGLGQWTADMFLMFHLRRPDVLPVGDQGIRRAVKVEYRLRKFPDPKRLEKIARPWRPHRTLACLYLWSLLDNTPG